MVKTAASHAVNIGSNPVRVTSSLPHDTMFHIVQARYSTSVIARHFRSDPLRWAPARGRRERLIALTKMLELRSFNIIVGIDCHEGPPVPIPNTEVKLMYADNTWRATAREDR